MCCSRFKAIKRNRKLNCDAMDPSRGEAGHNPARKCDLIWDVIVHNANCFMLDACPDVTVDKMTWEFGGHGEAKSDLVKRLKGKFKSRGGQTGAVKKK